MGFNRINSGRSIPTITECHVPYNSTVLSFNRINSGRSIPTQNGAWRSTSIDDVSIVSIQADQSRRIMSGMTGFGDAVFQSYQFRQINPDGSYKNAAVVEGNIKFQSYQFRQINPDMVYHTIIIMSIVKFQSYQFRQINPNGSFDQFIKCYGLCFNRINSGRSIPTRHNNVQFSNNIV